MDNIIALGITAVFFCVSYFIGTRNEKAHYTDIIAREKALINLPATNFKTHEDLPVAESRLAMGNVMIAGDFFKETTSKLASFFGMKIAVAESLVDRARREAILRMKESVPGADTIINIRVESAKINERQKMAGVEALAYGTAIYFKK
jgi:uncharacterized protein YbjQ (UPF0145 family)